MDYRYDSFCGLYCGSCPVLLAVKKGTIEEFAKRENMTPEDLECHGCKTMNRALFCKDCPFARCALERGIKSCIECVEYPCEELKKFQADEWPHHSLILKNLDRIREVGLDRWLEEQEKRWRCKECGEPFSWYDETCGNCGAKLYNCRDESNGLDKS
jgi:hypothetical protein